VQRYVLFLKPPNIFATFFQKSPKKTIFPMNIRRKPTDNHREKQVCQ